MAKLSEKVARVNSRANQVAAPAPQTPKAPQSVAKQSDKPKSKPALKLSLLKDEHMEAPQQPRQLHQQTSASKHNSYAAITAAGDPAQKFTVGRNKRTGPKAPKALKSLYNPNDQNVILQLHPSTPPAEENLPRDTTCARHQIAVVEAVVYTHPCTA